MGQLRNMLQAYPDFPKYAPIVQSSFLKMAEEFDLTPELTTLNTTELIKRYPDTSHEQWRAFLSHEIVQKFMDEITKFNAQVAFRKTQKHLDVEAARGNTNAMKQNVDISKVLTQSQQNRTVILTYVKRPTQHTLNDTQTPIPFGDIEDTTGAYSFDPDAPRDTPDFEPDNDPIPTPSDPSPDDSPAPF